MMCKDLLKVEQGKYYMAEGTDPEKDNKYFMYIFLCTDANPYGIWGDDIYNGPSEDLVYSWVIEFSDDTHSLTSCKEITSDSHPEFFL